LLEVLVGLVGCHWMLVVGLRLVVLMWLEMGWCRG